MSEKRRFCSGQAKNILLTVASPCAVRPPCCDFAAPISFLLVITLQKIAIFLLIL